MAKAIDKSFYNKNIKVSQATINQIKKMGMKEALLLARSFAEQGTGKEWTKETAGKEVRAYGRQQLKGEQAEAIKRLYGNRRYTEATAKGGNAIANAAAAKKAAAPKSTKSSGRGSSAY